MQRVNEKVFAQIDALVEITCKAAAGGKLLFQLARSRPFAHPVTHGLRSAISKVAC
jgi:hypothetical protein